MSGPRGSDANPRGDTPGTGADQPSAAAPTWQQPGQGAKPRPGSRPAARLRRGNRPPTPHAVPQYGQPPVAPRCPPTQQYGVAPEYNPAAYGQYGQPGVYGPPPQYGQYPAPGQYPPRQYPPPGSSRVSTRRRGSRASTLVSAAGPKTRAKKSARAIRAILGGLGAVLLALLLVLGFWKPGFFVTTKLDVNKAQQGRAADPHRRSQRLRRKNVTDVKCNNGQTDRQKGDTFNCEVSIDGTKRQVTVTFQDDKGTYEVGRPK